MADESHGRVEKLLHLLAQREGGHQPTAFLARHAGRTPSFWSQVLQGKKALGERLARSIEEQLNLPPRTLDDARSVSALYAADLIEAMPVEVQRQLLAVIEAARNPPEDLTPTMLAAVGRLLDAIAANRPPRTPGASPSSPQPPTPPVH